MAAKVAVTGGSGFIGSHVVDHLKEAGHDVLVIDSRARPHRSDVLHENVEIMDLSSLIHAVKGCDYVFHLAAVSDVNEAFKYPVSAVQVNISGTANVLEAARLNGVKRVLLASTVWVYTGTRDEGDLTEETPFYLPDAGHIYTSSKIAGEMLMHNYHQLYGQPFTILRYGIPYGPRMREALVIPIFVRKAFNGEALTIQGDGLQYRNYVYVEDLARVHVLALDEKAENQVYNLEGSEPVSIKRIAETIQALLGDSVAIEYLPARPGDYKGKVVSAEKVRRELGWEPQVDFEEGMKRYIAWYRENQKS